MSWKGLVWIRGNAKKLYAVVRRRASFSDHYCSLTRHVTLPFHFNVAVWLTWRRDVGQRQINVLYFNVDMNDFRQRQNSVVIFNVEFHNVVKRQNTIMKMTISKKNKQTKTFFTLLAILKEICRRVLAKPRKFL